MRLSPITFLLSSSLFLIAMTSSAQVAETIVAPKSNHGFPYDWVGHWEGTLDIYNNKGLAQSIPMELEISAIDTSDNFIWAIIYGEDKVAGRRSYELEIIDPTKGLYAIDEKNTIRLEAYLFQNKLYSRFEVMNNWLLCSYEKRNEQILFEIVSGAGEAVSTTGGQKLGEEDIPPVKAFPIVVNQRAHLLKKENK